jgi:methyl-accepting chemotaxis protein
MKWFYNLKIANKLIISFIFMALLTTLVGYQGITNMSQLNTTLDDMYNVETNGIIHIKNANHALANYARNLANFLLASSTADREKFLKTMDDTETRLLSEIAEAKNLMHTEEGKALIVDFENKWSDYKIIIDKIKVQNLKEALPETRQSVQLAQIDSRTLSLKINELLDELKLR